jgi:hypothetical protein
MCDFGADGLWAKNGCAVHPDELPVTEAIKTRLALWQGSYEARELHSGGRFDPLPPGFADEGRAIAAAIKGELPDWTVIYFDEDRCRYEDGGAQPRSEFEYEITP